MTRTTKDGDAKQPFAAKGFWRFLRAKKFYLPFCLLMSIVLLLIGIDLWRRWKIAALVVGILIALLGGCQNVRLFKAS
jgi:hypothetical protein